MHSKTLPGFVVKLAADAAALHFLDVQHMLGQTPDLFFALRQILHQTGLFRRHQASFRCRGQQFLFARKPFIDFVKPNCMTPAVRPPAATESTSRILTGGASSESSRTDAACASPFNWRGLESFLDQPALIGTETSTGFRRTGPENPC